MKCSALFFLLSSISSAVLAAPHAAAASGDLKADADKVEVLDDSPGSAGTWTVIVDNDDPRSLEELMAEMGNIQVKHIYNNTAFKGFSGSLSNASVSKMSVMSGLKTFEPELEVKLLDVQVNAPWGLQRISQGDAIANPPTAEASIAAFDFKYQFNGTTADLGKGVDIYVVDTGVNVDHIDFDGRAKFGFTIDTEQDDVGHGTHCAGTAGSTTFGIAKAANIIAVKVLSTDSGSTSDILKGIDFVIQNHVKRSKEAGFAGSVASMSLGSAVRSTSLDEAVIQASAAGIHFSVAAGNENQDACNSSPAGASQSSNAIAVGATTIDDNRASFSNFGKCTTIFAPGQDVTSTWIGGTNKINTISGTSMATPHVTGLLAYLLSQNPDLKTDTQGMKKLLLSTAGKLSTDKGTVPFANNGFTADAPARKAKRDFARI
ncbi:peptidase S8/S53 domain-containing protein [Sphaerosporella brunnea]|uniref:Peptidase S8/S53 domain-containing protein n=1 Tax=Sphaerosporella brunnea TaxID=1250544 RepID=A0A5J5ELK7_9PEZI|nr:peptidase S8/S53 domain-containing protein [Sphaerosporella brunnea]